ncbi:acyl-[acyl-carrier-protein]--UDP-N-acetylglucosamine O-acyltransferase [bacterium M21]|nr:acyl-[acyl-carrier-protein]--UDP-N-acetylglucosamine O-acyltransferase [bacterium M21]OVE81047.1 acyl-[acyl-carrier-protein]--UDP-N-acetylglucosamine O-acyltransferase [bacterium M21]
MKTDIHPAAVIEDGAVIGDGCKIGPFCYVGPNVKLGKNNLLHSNVVIDGNTEMGDGNEVYSFACLGKVSQDLKFKAGMVAYTKIGDGNTFREYVTVNAASEGATTTIGNNCLFLSYSHIAHDCILGNNIIISTDTKMAGHVEVGNHAIINAKTGIVQFVRIGDFAFIGGLNKVAKDILPYCIADGIPSEIRAINKIGLERNGYDADAIKRIYSAYKAIIRSGKPLDEAAAELQERFPDDEDVQKMITFAQESKLGLARPRAK